MWTGWEILTVFMPLTESLSLVDELASSLLSQSAVRFIKVCPLDRTNHNEGPFQNLHNSFSGTNQIACFIWFYGLISIITSGKMKFAHLRLCDRNNLCPITLYLKIIPDTLQGFSSYLLWGLILGKVNTQLYQSNSIISRHNVRYCRTPSPSSSSKLPGAGLLASNAVKITRHIIMAD